MKNQMLYNRLGSSGLQISRLAFGSWITFHNQVAENQAHELMAYAFDQGINFFDNAEVYAGGKSETIMGETLKKLNWPRIQYIVSTKFYWGLADGPNQKNTLNRKYLLNAIEGSLKRLQLEYVDLIYCHRPDPQTPLQETVRAMNDIINKGQALYWGTSEWGIQEILEADQIAAENSWHRPVVEQPQYNLFERLKVEKEFIPAYDRLGLGLTTWSPLASGILTGKYLKEIPSGSRLDMKSMSWLIEWALDAKKKQQVESFIDMARSLGTKPSQLAIAWCLTNPRVSSVILGASQLGQLKENLAALEVLPALKGDILKNLNDLFKF